MFKRKKNPTEFELEVKKVIKEKFKEKSFYPLNHLVKTIEDTENNLKRKVRVYKWSAFILLFTIPLLATLMSTLISINNDCNAPVGQSILLPLLSYTSHLSILLTLMTILNSIFKPGERFRTSCFMRIKISNYKCDLLAELETIQTTDEKELLDIVQKHCVNLKKYQEQLVGLFLPESLGENK